MSNIEQYKKIEFFKNMLVEIATGGKINEDEYNHLRTELLGFNELSGLLPEFVKSFRSSQEFWHFIKPKFSTYGERMIYISSEFSKIFDFLEKNALKNNFSKSDFNVEDYFNTMDEHFNTNAYFWYLSLKKSNLFQSLQIPFAILANYLDFSKNYNRPISIVDKIEEQMNQCQLNKNQRLFIYDKLNGLIANAEPSIQDKLSTINIEIIDRRWQLEPNSDLDLEKYNLESIMMEAEKIQNIPERIKFLRHKKLSYEKDAEDLGWDIGLGDEIQIEIEHLEGINITEAVIRNSKKSKILFLAANPKDSTRLRVDEEVREIETVLKLSKERDNFILSSKWAITPSTLQQAILDESPDVVHFSGHGTGTGILLEDMKGDSIIVSESALESLFSLFSESIKCVILNSCYSEIQAKAIAKNIRYVIGMNNSISDKTAITFSVGFYRALGSGKDVEFAFKLGINAIQLQGLSGETIPHLIENK